LRNLPGTGIDDFIVKIIGEMGRHPDVIKATLEASNKTKNRSIRSLKSKLKTFDKKIKMCSGQIRSCLDVTKKKGAEHLSKEFLREAELLAADKHEAEASREKVKAEIRFQEHVITDEKVIAEALLRFEEVFATLSFEDKIELLGLLIRRIEVTRYDPEKGISDTKNWAYTMRLRTSWYLVKIQFFAEGLFSGSYANSNKSSKLNINGDP